MHILCILDFDVLFIKSWQYEAASFLGERCGVGRERGCNCTKLRGIVEEILQVVVIFMQTVK